MRRLGRSIPCFVAVLALGLYSPMLLAWGNHWRIAGTVKQVTGCATDLRFDHTEADWPDWPAHNDGAGTVYVDEEYGHSTCAYVGDMAHFYKAINGTGCNGNNGRAHTNAQGFFDKANSFWNSGSPSTGARTLMRGQHYVEDVGNPWHTTLDADQICHGSVESWAGSLNYHTLGFATSVKNGATYAKNNTSTTYDKSGLVATAANQSLKIAKDNGINCLTYSWSSKNAAWNSIFWYVGYYNYRYVKPICS